MRRPTKEYSLIIVTRNQEVLLGKKRRGFGAGLWNAFGGKREPGETILDCARRELKEETNLNGNSLKKLAVVTYEMTGQPLKDVHIYFTDSFTGTVEDSDEMSNSWFSKDNIPYDQMWPDVRIWWSLFESRIPFNAYFQLNHQRVIWYKLNQIDAQTDEEIVPIDIPSA